MIKKTSLSFIAALSTILFSLTAQASSVDATIMSCAKLSSDADRLDCYDKLALTIKTSDVEQPNHMVKAPEIKTPPSIVNVNKPLIIPRTKKDIVNDFGSSHLKNPHDKPEEEKSIILTLTETKKGPRGKLILTFENGQVWKQSSSEYFSAKVGDKLKFTEGMLGAIYLKKVGTKRSIRVKRVK